MTNPPDDLSRRHLLQIGAVAGTGLGLTAITAPLSAAQGSYLDRKAPGVYIAEINAFPNSVVSVATGIPAFIGHTDSASHNGQDLYLKPTGVNSLTEFTRFFGQGPQRRFDLIPSGTDPAEVHLPTGAGDQAYTLSETAPPYRLYDAVRLFFDNGGGSCIVVSVGGYSDPVTVNGLESGLTALEADRTSAILLIPDAASLPAHDAASVHNAMLNHCAAQQSRFAILDLVNGDQPRGNDPFTDPVTRFRNGLSSDGLSYGAAYYPWLNAALYDPATATYEALTPAARGLLSAAVAAQADTLLSGKSEADRRVLLAALAGTPHPDAAPPAPGPAALDALLTGNAAFYPPLKRALLGKLNLQPPSGAMAGIYARTDREVGVWHAPANRGLNSVISLTVALDSPSQMDLNAPIDGRAINALRAFNGRGLTVWGARTLDANSIDWRYISQRRTLIMIEQSIQQALNAYAFAPNTADTWVTVQASLSSFLNNLWQAGALQGSKPSESFAVSVGLGSTMTAQNILDGWMIVSVAVSTTHPAEFTALTFTQQMPTQ